MTCLNGGFRRASRVEMVRGADL